MGEIKIDVSKELDAGADIVYGIIKDFNDGHPRILPEEYFKDLVVKEGGLGAGTAVEVTMTLMGGEQLLDLLIEEPEPGRVMIERDVATGVVTTFTVDPLANGRCEVTIASTIPDSGGIRGLFERWLAPSALRRVYREELALLQEAATV